MNPKFRNTCVYFNLMGWGASGPDVRVETLMFTLPSGVGRTQIFNVYFSALGVGAHPVQVFRRDPHVYISTPLFTLAPQMLGP